METRRKLPFILPKIQMSVCMCMYTSNRSKQPFGWHIFSDVSNQLNTTVEHCNHKQYAKFYMHIRM